MKIFKEILLYIIMVLMIIGSLLFVVNQLDISNHTTSWYSVLSSVSTSFAAIASILLLLVTFFYLLATRNMVGEMKKQRLAQEEPVVSVRIVPDSNNFGILNINVKNTGGGPAYNVSVKFEPDLPYHSSSINKLRMFNDMPVLDKNETIEFLFASAHSYFNSENSKTTTAFIEYYRRPKTNKVKGNEPVKREIKIDLEERAGQLYVNRNGMHDLVKEVEEIKQGILMLLTEKNFKDGRK